MQQHRQAAHKQANMQAAPASRPRRTRAAKNVGRNVASVAIPQRIVTRTGDVATLSGTDRMQMIPDVSALKTGHIIYSELITPGDFARLKNVARSFQRIRYNSLRFRIEPQMSTATSGGYVTAFVADPADTAPQTGVLNYLTSQKGSQTCKWWQNSTVVMPSTPRLFYTSNSVEVREYSPGRLMVAVDGQASQKGNLTVFCEWNVTLSVASMEAERAVVEDFTIATDLYTRTEYTGLWSKKSGAWGTSNFAELIPGSVKGMGFTLPYPVVFQESTTVSRNIWYLLIKDDSTVVPARESYTDVVTTNPVTEVLFLKRGTPLEVAHDPAPAGYSAPEPDFQESSASSSEELMQGPSANLEMILSNFLEKFEITLKRQLGDQEPCPSRARSFSMDSQASLQASLSSAFSIVPNSDPEALPTLPKEH